MMLAVREPSVLMASATRTARRERERKENEEEIKMRKRRMKSIKAERRATVITADLWLPAASQLRLSPTLPTIAATS